LVICPAGGLHHASSGASTLIDALRAEIRSEGAAG
jgi:hypothetical protein